MSATDTATLAAVPVSLPSQQLQFLNGDGTVSLPWRRFLQQLYTRTGGGTDQIATGQNSLGSAVSSSTTGVAQALANSQAALDASDLGALLGMIERPEVSTALTLGDVLAFAALRQARRVVVTDDGSLAVSDLHVIDFEGAGVTVTASPNRAVVTVPGGGGGSPPLLPLVNGDTPVVGLICTPDGQCIGVPQS